MENPYAASWLAPELIEEERRRPKLWRGMLWAYAVHHLLSVLGIAAGTVFKPSEWHIHFPHDKPVELLETLLLTPVFDLYLVLEPPLSILGHPGTSIEWWWWLRSLAVLTIPVSVFIYGVSRRHFYLWYIGFVSFVVFVSFVMSKAIDQAG